MVVGLCGFGGPRCPMRTIQVGTTGGTVGTYKGGYNIGTPPRGTTSGGAGCGLALRKEGKWLVGLGLWKWVRRRTGACKGWAKFFGEVGEVGQMGQMGRNGPSAGPVRGGWGGLGEMGI